MTVSTVRHVCPTCRRVYRGGFPRCPRDGAELTELGPEGLAGARVGAGRYVLGRVLGSGGAGLVSEGTDERTGRRYAIKLLFGDLAVQAEMARRFRREAEVASKLDHPHVAAVIDFSIDVEGEPDFLVMELARGENLGDRVRRAGPLEEAEARHILAGVCDGLSHAHQQGVVHRDVKPENIILADEGRWPRVVDFGVARFAGSAPTGITRHGMVLGTPGFLAPEVLRGRSPDAPTDLYGLGITAYYALTARLPFRGEETEVLEQTLAGVATPHLDERPLSAPFVAWVRALIAERNAGRPGSAAEALDALRALPPPPAVSAPPGAWISAHDPSVPPRAAGATPPPPLTVPGISAWPPGGAETSIVPEVQDTLRKMRDSAVGDDPAPDSSRSTPVPEIPTPVPERSRGPGVVVGLVLSLGLVVALTFWLGGTAAPPPEPSPSAPAAPPADRPPIEAKPEVVEAASAKPSTAAPAPPAASAPKTAGASKTAPPPPRRRRAAPRAASAKPAAKAPDARRLGQAYVRLGAALDALEAAKGKAAVAPLRARYFDLPVADALRRPERVPAVYARVQALAAAVEARARP